MKNTFNAKNHQIPIVKVAILGDRGTLEGTYGIGSTDKAAPTILLFPHEADNNQVLQSVFELVLSMGFTALRTDFASVGNTAGVIENGFGEFLDATSAFKWLMSHTPYAKHRWVLGISFGAYIMAQLTNRQPEIDNFIFLSAPLSLYDSSFLSPCPVHGLFIQAKNDGIISEEQLFEFFLKNDEFKNISYFTNEKIQNSNHLFKNIDEKTSILLPIYKYIKEEMHWDGLNLIQEYEDMLDSIKFLVYEDFAKNLNKDLSEVIFDEY